MIELRNLNIGYKNKDQSKVILSSINAHLEAGKFTCFLGRNGTGKSTLLKTILGIIDPIEGNVLIDGKDYLKYSANQRAKIISAVLTDYIRIDHLSVYDFVALGRIPYTSWSGRLLKEDRDKIVSAISICEIEDIVDKSVSQLSDGQLQKVSIARAICQDTDVILLDEPTAHLDVPNKFKVFEILRKLAIDHKKSVFVITHDLELAFQNADNLWVVDKNNNILSDLTEDLMLNTELIDFFRTDEFAFDYKSGKFIYKRTSSVEISVEGREDAVYWTTQALIKNGYSVEKGSDYQLEITQTSDEAYSWVLRFNNGEDILQSKSLKELICNLNMHFFPEFNPK